MSKISGITVLLLTQVWLASGCDDPYAAESGVADVEDDEDAVEDDDEFRAWTGYTSEENPPLICQNRNAVRGIDCMGDYCDNISLDCRFTGRLAGEHSWLPYFSEEGSSTADEGHCIGDNTWMTGIVCRGSYCDDISMRCSVLIGSSTGTCTWSAWYSEEQGPFTAPSGRYIKGMECDGSYCDNKRYYYCWMN
jgi:hypothetical protein